MSSVEALVEDPAAFRLPDAHLLGNSAFLYRYQYAACRSSRSNPELVELGARWSGRGSG
jgi:hypothetical protein